MQKRVKLASFSALAQSGVSSRVGTSNAEACCCQGWLWKEWFGEHRVALLVRGCFSCCKLQRRRWPAALAVRTSLTSSLC